MNLRRLFFLQLGFSLTIIIGITLFIKIESFQIFYRSNFYPHLSHGFRILSQVFPFSLGDLLYIFGLVFIIKRFVDLIKARFKTWKLFLLNLWKYINLMIASFYLFWGLNNFIAPTLNLGSFPKKTLSESELSHEVLNQINELNALYKGMGEIDFNSLYKGNANTLADRVSEHYMLSSSVLNLQPYRAYSVKPSMFSTPLSYMGFSGYLNPFTLEAQYNFLIPASSKPMTISHEIAHQLGVAHEELANFVGLANLMLSGKDDLKFSGMISLFSYSYSALRRVNPGEASALLKELDPGILALLRSNQEFWMAYENPLEPVFKSMYGGYLKSQNQSSGILSYNNFLPYWWAFNEIHRIY